LRIVTVEDRGVHLPARKIGQQPLGSIFRASAVL
jgi:hypothetical protein